MNNKISMGKKLVLVIPDQPGNIELQSLRIFEQRVKDRGTYDIIRVPSSEYKIDKYEGYPIFVGRAEYNPSVAQILTESGLAPVSESEGYLLSVSDKTIICGADENGLLYGLGRLLRIMNYRDTGISVEAVIEKQHPVGKERGVYFATHFNNWYESASIDEFERYVEDMALWGVNRISTWFDMNWFPDEFWMNPDSRGMQMVNKIKRVYEIAHSLGMKAGLAAIANEGFSHQPGEDLQVDSTAQRGGFYPFSQICPSKPGGMDLILRNRRKILELIGPIDSLWYWPYDQGGCGCSGCMDENGWGKKFLEIGPQVAEVVKELNPNVEFIVSTWLMNDAEIGLVRKQMESGADWFTGILVETHRTDEFETGKGYTLWVFPEISMFETFFVSYGCNGANPAPVKFAEDARKITNQGYGSVLYSEGIYEDINKIIWAAVMWNPDRSAQDVVSEYSKYYFGTDNMKTGLDVILELEKTWGVYKLPQTSLQKTEEIINMLQSIKVKLPDAEWCRWRWQVLSDRALIDHRMVKVGPDKQIMKEAKELFDQAGYSDDLSALRDRMILFKDTIQDRVDGVDALFKAYWDYLERFHLNSVMLIFKPDCFLGSTDYTRLLKECEKALSMESNKEMAQAFIRAIHRWFWFNGPGVDFLFL
ncbi:MAG: hypothetical protein ACYC27_02395 [Armatimonadota bacterium]